MNTKENPQRSLYVWTAVVRVQGQMHGHTSHFTPSAFAHTHWPEMDDGRFDLSHLSRSERLLLSWSDSTFLTMCNIITKFTSGTSVWAEILTEVICKYRELNVFNLDSDERSLFPCMFSLTQVTRILYIYTRY